MTSKRGVVQLPVVAGDSNGRSAAPPPPSGTDLVASYRSKLLRMSQELELERQQHTALRAEVATLRVQLATTRSVGDGNATAHVQQQPSMPAAPLGALTEPACACSGAGVGSPCLATTSATVGAAPHCGSDRCIHKTALASRIIDRTFDDYKMRLREQLREAQAELQRLRSGGSTAAAQTDNHQEELRALRQALAEERQRSEGLQGEIRQMKIDQFMEKRGGAASSSFRNGAPLAQQGSISSCIPSTPDGTNRREGLLVQVAQQALMQQLLMRYLVHLDGTMVHREDWLTTSTHTIVEAMMGAVNDRAAEASPPVRDPVEVNTHRSSGLPVATTGPVGGAFSRYRPRVPTTHHHQDHASQI